MRLLAIVLALALPAYAQQPAGSDWTKVEAIRTGTRIRVAAQHTRVTCTFITADNDSLTCVRTPATLVVSPGTRRVIFRRPEVASVKLCSRFLSGLAGAGLGAAVGAGIGAGVQSQQASSEDGNLLTVFGALIGGIVGGSVGSFAEFVATPTVYRAP